jgi:hypothetical protein
MERWSEMELLSDEETADAKRTIALGRSSATPDDLMSCSECDCRLSGARASAYPDGRGCEVAAAAPREEPI